MAFLTAVGSLAASTSSTSQSISTLAFEPKGLIFFGNRVLTDGSSTDASMTLGFVSSTISTNQFSYSINARDAISSAVTGTAAASSLAYLVVDGGNSTTIIRQGHIGTLTTNGFTMNWRQVNAAPHIVNYLAIGGSDITQTKVTTYEASTVSGTAQQVVLGFQPTFVAVMQGGSSGVGPAAGGFSLFSLGFASSTTQQGCAGTASEDVVLAADTYRNLLSTSIAELSDFAGGSTSNLRVTEFNSSGVVITVAKKNATPLRIWVFAIDGGTHHVGTLTRPTSTGTQTVSTIALTPAALMLMSVNDVASTAQLAHARFTLGAAASSVAEGSIWHGDQDAAANMIADAALDRTRLFTAFTEGTPTNTVLGGVQNFDANGYTLRWETVDSTAANMLYWAMGTSNALPVSAGHWAPFMLMGAQR